MLTLIVPGEHYWGYPNRTLKGRLVQKVKICSVHVLFVHVAILSNPFVVTVVRLSLRGFMHLMEHLCVVMML